MISEVLSVGILAVSINISLPKDVGSVYKYVRGLYFLQKMVKLDYESPRLKLDSGYYVITLGA